MDNSYQHDSVDLNRFIDAQEFTYCQALAELRAGQKSSHWSWFVLPQLRGLGTSAMSVRYALSGISEARAYLEHPILGSRLKETVAILLSHNSSAAQILGDVDAKKFRSCLTVFNLAANKAEPLFQYALDKFFSGVQDPATLAILAKSNEPN